MENIFKLKLRNRPFEAILNGQKRVEIRANKQEGRVNYNKVTAGDILIFENEVTKQEINCIVKRKSHYESIRELLINEGTYRSLSSTNSMRKGIKSIESIEDYKEVISKHGVFAIEIELTKLPPTPAILHGASNCK